MDSMGAKGRWEQAVRLLDYFVASVVPAECIFKVLREANPERRIRTTCYPCPTAVGLCWAGNF